jgi:pyruvate, water dikinase
VMFTADPINRRKDRMIVEAVFGIGESAVSGAVTPDHYVLDRNGAVKRKRIVHGGVLQEDELVALADMGRTLEQHFSGPQDIEWAMVHGRLYLLQSRPITTL